MPDVVLKCVQCGQHSSAIEAFARKKNPGFCRCGGAFSVAFIARLADSNDYSPDELCTGCGAVLPCAAHGDE